MKPWSWLLVAALICSLSAAELPATNHAFVVIAHRGNHTRAHENTLTALEHAIEAGADYAEIDVRKTADGHYVLMHDSRVDRMTDGHGLVAELTLAQVKTLSVRDLKRPEIPPDKVPTLEEALARIKGRLHLYLDFKAGDRADVAKRIRRAGVDRQVLVYDDASRVEEWHRTCPDLPVITSPPETLKTAAALVDFAEKSKIEVLDGDWTAYTREMVQAAERAGIRVWPDIQEEKENADYFAKVVALGFTGAQTDHPEEFIAWLKQKSLR
jgi:glycerophosphoryl diester phosphodiesterase